jgi:hypothetical protein
MLPVVLYSYETWSLASRKEHKLRLCENKGLKRICGHEGEEVTGRRQLYGD